MNQPELSIVLPCYNEADNLPAIFKRFGDLFLENDDIEIILVNNGSVDNSLEVMKRLSIGDQRFRICDISVNQGYGHGIMSGLEMANGEYIAWTHADLQTDAKDVIDALKKMKSQENPKNVFMKGRRKRRNFLDSFFTFGMSIVSSFAMGGLYHDVNAQPKLFHRSFVKKMDNPPDDFSLDLYSMHLAKKNNYREMQHPVYFHDRVNGEAKGGGTMIGKTRLIIRTLKYIFELRSRRY
ncbi:glycosyltransferase family 2 protein [Rhodopirellula sp.]|nr:glycosyltransferase family 2 protein [Rhodopirellula sp.]